MTHSIDARSTSAPGGTSTFPASSSVPFEADPFRFHRAADSAFPLVLPYHRSESAGATRWSCARWFVKSTGAQLLDVKRNRVKPAGCRRELQAIVSRLEESRHRIAPGRALASPAAWYTVLTSALLARISTFPPRPPKFRGKSGVRPWRMARTVDCVEDQLPYRSRPRSKNTNPRRMVESVPCDSGCSLRQAVRALTTNPVVSSLPAAPHP